jgi:hypothetical protein
MPGTGERVDQQQVGLERQRQHGPLHGDERRAQDVHAVDLFVVGDPDPEADRLGADARVEGDALARGEALGVVDAVRDEPPAEHDGAATTGPQSAPRPTSSTPATTAWPAASACSSNCKEQTSSTPRWTRFRLPRFDAASIPLSLLAAQRGAGAAPGRWP